MTKLKEGVKIEKKQVGFTPENYRLANITKDGHFQEHVSVYW